MGPFTSAGGKCGGNGRITFKDEICFIDLWRRKTVPCSHCNSKVGVYKNFKGNTTVCLQCRTIIKKERNKKELFKAVKDPIKV